MQGFSVTVMRFISKVVRPNPANPRHPLNPDANPVGVFASGPADPRSPIPERGSGPSTATRLVIPRGNPIGGDVRGPGGIRGFRGMPKCPETGFSGPWCRFRVRGGVLVFPPSRSWHHGPLLGSRESFPSPSGHPAHPAGPAPPSPIAIPYRLPASPSLSPIPAALLPVNPVEKPPFPSFLLSSCPESRGCPSESSCNPMRNPMAVRRIFQL